MLGIPFFSIWIFGCVLFILAIGIGIWALDSELPWWAMFGLMGAVILLALLGWGIHKVGREYKS